MADADGRRLVRMEWLVEDDNAALACFGDWVHYLYKRNGLVKGAELVEIGDVREDDDPEEFLE